MKLTTIKNVVTSKLGRQLLHVQKSSPTILFGAGIAGIVGTVVLASRATLKLDELLEDTQEKLEKARTLEHHDYSETDRKRDITLIYAQAFGKIARAYTPAVITGVLSVAAITGSHVILTRRNLGLTAAYATLDRGFQEYRRRVIGELGSEKDIQFRRALVDKEIVEETDSGPTTKVVKALGSKDISGYSMFFDEGNRNWSRQPWQNQMFLQCQQRYANDLLNSRGHVFLNEVLDMLGFQRTRAGAVVGWINDGNGDNFVDFGVFSGDEYMGQEFVSGNERSVLLDFNVDGVIYDKI